MLDKPTMQILYGFLYDFQTDFYCDNDIYDF